MQRRQLCFVQSALSSPIAAADKTDKNLIHRKWLAYAENSAACDGHGSPVSGGRYSLIRYIAPVIPGGKLMHASDMPKIIGIKSALFQGDNAAIGYGVAPIFYVSAERTKNESESGKGNHAE